MDLLEQRNWFDSLEFQEKYHCKDPLGSFCGKDGTVFRLWAPTAQAVTLHLYDRGNDCGPWASVAMEAGERGLWSYRTEYDLHGKYYDYDVTVDHVTRRTADPYARACGINGLRSMVIDLRRTDPDGWEKDAPPPAEGESVIYELHVKDFSWDPCGGFPAEDRGRYSAFCRSGTTLNNDGVHPTGIDYLKRLGVTHIQLLPIYDYGSVDEANSAEQYNWGYDPANYNIPEGSYSSNPWQGEVRIRELKEAVQSLHRNGFRVIMDVVYNHTYALDSWLWRSVPWYYYRQNEDGSASNGSGCGNELATERSMCARYIMESVLFWAEEYHIDGFRFDLMGLLDTRLMNRIRFALDQRYGRGEKLVYGEPWGAAGSAVRPGTVLCSKDHIRELDPHIGAFCDNTRDAVKGGLMHEKDRGFVNGGYVSADYLRHCIAGWSCGKEEAPSQTITYLSCHDDWTLWDKLICTMSPRKRFHSRLPGVLRANRLAAAINFCCQGYPFLLSGEEFARTKGGVKNSYCSAPEINQLDWKRAWENRRLVDYYRGLIALRKQLPCLTDKSEGASERIVFAKELADGCFGILLESEKRWNQILLIFQTGEVSNMVALPEGKWQILADENSSFRWKERKFVQSSAKTAPVSAMILGRIADL